MSLFPKKLERFDYAIDSWLSFDSLFVVEFELFLLRLISSCWGSAWATTAFVCLIF